MVTANYDDVRFDFEGSLVLARNLWSTADELLGTMGKRAAAADVALWSWKGRFADDFVDRRSQEHSEGERVVAALHEEAVLWAQAWAEMMNEQNDRLRARAVDREREARSLIETIADHVTGSDDSDAQVPLAPVLTAPIGPAFAPTGSLVSY